MVGLKKWTHRLVRVILRDHWEVQAKITRVLIRISSRNGERDSELS